MKRSFFGILAFGLGVLALSASGPAQAQIPGIGNNEEGKTLENKVFKFIHMDAVTIVCEGWYPGSDHTGGGWMSCMARYEITEPDGTIRVEDVNVSAQSEWSIQYETIYWVEQGATLFEDGLFVDPWFLDVNEGYTYVYATYQGQTVSGDIFVYDYRNP